MFTKGITHRAGLLACAATYGLLPAIGHAQDAEPSNEPSGSAYANTDIIVTATRRGESLKDVAMSINVATGDSLQKLAIFDAKDVQQLAPGLEMTNTTGRNNSTTLRGIAFDPDQGTAPAVQVYFNEVPADAQVAYTAIYDLQQVEVLRGPQGLLRGLSAPAGAITFTSRRPSFDVIEGYAQASVTDLAGYNVQSAVSFPVSEAVSLRFAVLADGNRLNFVRNLNRDQDRSRSSTQSFRATLGLRPTEQLEAYITYQYLIADRRQYQQVVGAGNAPVYNAGPFIGIDGPLSPDLSLLSGPPLGASDYAAVSVGLYRSQLNSHVLNANVNYDLGAATLSFVGAHQYSTQDIQRDLDQANAVPGYIGFSEMRIPIKLSSGELRLESNNVEGLGWNLGAFYRKQTGDTIVNEVYDNFFFPAQLGGAYAYLPINGNLVIPISDRTWSFNAGLRFQSGSLKIEGGLRYSLIRNVYTATITSSSPGAPGFPPVEDPFSIVQQGVPSHLQIVNEKPLTGGLNISYALSPALNVYASYGRSFRAGASGVGVQPGLSEDLIQTGPEKTDSWEVGLKGNIFDRRLNFGLAGFYQAIDGYLSRFDQIYYNCREIGGVCSDAGPPVDNSVESPNGVFAFNYNGDAKIWGVELELNVRPTNDWDIGVSAAYIKARFDDALLPCNSFVNGVPVIQGSGNISYCNRSGRLSDTPDFTLTANTEIRAPMGKVTPYLRALLNYRPSFTASRSTFEYQSRELVNLFLGVRHEDEAWDVNLFARNILGQSRITSIGDGNFVVNTAAGIPFDSGYRTVSVMAPREFGVTASFTF